MSTKIVSRILYDDETGIPFFEDIQGNLHMAGNWAQAIPLPPVRYYLQTISYLRFPNTKEFHPIPNELTGKATSEYIVPPSKQWRPAFVMASQDLLKHKKVVEYKRIDGMSIIGFFINDELTITVPFKNDLHYVLYEPLSFSADTKLEFKLRPYRRNVRVCILVGGELRES